MIEKKPRKIEPVEPITVKHQSFDGKVIEKTRKDRGFKKLLDKKMEELK